LDRATYCVSGFGFKGGNLWYNSNSELADVAQEVGAVCVLDGKEEGMIRGELEYFLSY